MPEKVSYSLILSYEGSVFKGWHTQTTAITVQGTLNDILTNLYGKKIFTWGAGRTDSGAHALSYTAHFRTHNDILPVEKMKHIFNSKLPPEIRVYEVKKVNNFFHATFSCLARSYCYVMYLGDILPPRLYKKVYHEREELDVEKIKKLLPNFVGTYDFTQFCYGYNAKERETKTMVRRLDSFRVKRIGDYLIFFIKGEGFLRGMIRTLIGTTLSVAKGIMVEKDALNALYKQESLPNGRWKPVPAEGLYFKRAHYNHEEFELKKNCEDKNSL